MGNPECIKVKLAYHNFMIPTHMQVHKSAIPGQVPCDVHVRTVPPVLPSANNSGS